MVLDKPVGGHTVPAIFSILGNGEMRHLMIPWHSI